MRRVGSKKDFAAEDHLAARPRYSSGEKRLGFVFGDLAQIQLERFQIIVGIQAIKRCCRLLAQIIVNKVDELWIQLGLGS